MAMRWSAAALVLLLLALGETTEGRSLSQLVKSLREFEQAGSVKQGEIDSVLDADDPKAAAQALLERAEGSSLRQPPPPPVVVNDKSHPRGRAKVVD